MNPRPSGREQRPDGRSDRRVVIDLVADAPPATVFTYDQLHNALAAGLSEPPPRKRVYRAVSDANNTLYRARYRWLEAITGTGYRVVETRDPNGTPIRFVRHKLDRDVYDVLVGDPAGQVGTIRRVRTGTRSTWRVQTTVAGPLPPYNRFRNKNEAAAWLRRQSATPQDETPPEE